MELQDFVMENRVCCGGTRATQTQSLNTLPALAPHSSAIDFKTEKTTPRHQSCSKCASISFHSQNSFCLLWSVVQNINTTLPGKNYRKAKR